MDEPIITNSFPVVSQSSQTIQALADEQSGSGVAGKTILSPVEESQFQLWAARVNPPTNNFDVRGYWKANFAVKTSYRWDD